MRNIEAKRLVSILKQVLLDEKENSWLRFRVADVLDYRGLTSPGELTCLSKIFRDKEENSSLRFNIAKFLHSKGLISTKELLETFRDKGERGEVRYYIADYLLEKGLLSKQEMAELTDLIKNKEEEPWLRIEVHESLAEAGAINIYELYDSIADEEENGWFRFYLAKKMFNEGFIGKNDLMGIKDIVWSRKEVNRLRYIVSEFLFMEGAVKAEELAEIVRDKDEDPLLRYKLINLLMNTKKLPKDLASTLLELIKSFKGRNNDRCEALTRAYKAEIIDDSSLRTILNDGEEHELIRYTALKILTGKNKIHQNELEGFLFNPSEKPRFKYQIACFLDKKGVLKVEHLKEIKKLFKQVREDYWLKFALFKLLFSHRFTSKTELEEMREIVRGKRSDQWLRALIIRILVEESFIDEEEQIIIFLDKEEEVGVRGTLIDYLKMKINQSPSVNGD